MCEKTVVFPSLLWDCDMIIQLSLLWQLVSPLRFEFGSWEMQFDSIARGGFASDHKSRAGHLFLLVRSRPPNRLYLQMLLAPWKGVFLSWGSPDYLYSLYLLLLDSQLWIDVDSASTCLYKSDPISWYYRFAVIWYTWIFWFKDRTSRKDMAFFLHVDSSRPWQLIALSVWWNAMPGSFVSSSEKSKLYEWTRTLHDRVATIVTSN